MRESTGDSIEAGNASWNFGGNVPSNFETHVSRSIPLYREGHDLILKLSDFFLAKNSTCYDIGCSNGRLTESLYQRHHEKSIHVVGVDIEPDMIDFAQASCDAKKNLKFICADIADLDLEPADLIVSYYSIQFIRPRVRQEVFNKIYAALNWGGAFILFEKVRGGDGRFQDIMTSLYTDFKLEGGYSPNEIISKARSLKGVLEPFSTNGNLELLQRAGFVDVMSIMKYVCFEGFLAIK